MSFVDNSGKVKDQMAHNVQAALAAMGIEATGLIVKQMQSGYGKPIWQTGDLQRDVNSAPQNSGPDTVDVGNSIGYGVFVHEGTSRMSGRPYIKDAIMGGTSRLKQVAETELKKGF
jgi:HK97 gp10 family phage protein